MNKNGVLGKLVGAMVGFLRPARGNSSSTDLFQLAGRKSGDMRPGPWLKNAPTNGGRVYPGSHATASCTYPLGWSTTCGTTDGAGCGPAGGRHE